MAAKPAVQTGRAHTATKVTVRGAGPSMRGGLRPWLPAYSSGFRAVPM